MCVFKLISESALVLTHDPLRLQVSVRIKKQEDGAVWIRIAWGDNLTRPNHLKPTYAVHYLQTPYVFILNIAAKHKPFLYQVPLVFTSSSAVSHAVDLSVVILLLSLSGVGSVHQTRVHKRGSPEWSKPHRHARPAHEALSAGNRLYYRYY